MTRVVVELKFFFTSSDLWQLVMLNGRVDRTRPCHTPFFASKLTSLFPAYKVGVKAFDEKKTVLRNSIGTGYAL